ncbi:hypothetical protein D3C87_557510 [compost metagenome]
MEIVLLIAIVIVLIVFLTKLSSKLDVLQQNFYEMNRKLDHYKNLAENQKSQDTNIVQPIAVPIPQPEAPPVESIPQPIEVVEEKPAEIPIPEPQEQEIPEATLRPVAMQKPAEPENIQRPAVALPKQKTWWENFKEQNPDLERFIGENLINKIGILILVLGISYFVKFAIDKDWIGEPARVGIGILAGGIVMLVAHKLRVNYKAFSSVLVAGAISIFYFTIVVAFHDYHLFSQTVAFIIMVVITAFSAFISVSYNRMELAALTLIGGFAAPFMVSTGSGNYVVLFTYITILNVGILLIAYYKKWGFINLMAYIFTVILYGGWLSTIVGGKTAPYFGALVFGFIFYLIFILMNIINNIKTKTSFSNIQLSIFVSNTFLFYTAGMVILENSWPQYKGIFTLLLGVFNFCFAWLLYKKLDMDQKVIYILIGLTLTFVTLAIPIQFEGNYITLFWAAEAVLLMWLAQKSKIENFRFGSVIVHILMLISLMMDWVQIYYYNETLNIIANRAFLTGAFAIASCIAVIQVLKHDSGNYKAFGIVFNVEGYSKFMRLFVILLIYIVGFIELKYQANYYLESIYAVNSLTVLYHLLFSVGVLQWFCISKSSNAQNFGTVLGIINTVIFIVLFSLFAYYEIEEYIAGQIESKFAYWLHYAMLATVLYTVVQLYKINREIVLASFKGQSLLPWITIFFLVYLASSEMMLHGLAISLTPITQEDINSALQLSQYKGYSNQSIASLLADRNITTVSNQIIKTGYPVLWGIMACMLLLLGIKKQMKSLRIAALILLGITIAKLFIYDIRNASETGKIIAFILLGVLILVISFVYQKIKLLVIADKPEDNTIENSNENN